jgi:hypothetical protein
MALPIAAIKYKLRSIYPNYKFEIKQKAKERLIVINVFFKGKDLGYREFIPETSMDDFWATIREWMRTLIR